ncbi:S23 ribosomal protein OS=Fischerella sp. JSC-11 GN=FJSC11DRAFT_4052 PE=4 SV=1: 23S_rRNA_IVP [Gemmataceae bacterium]|nr:S23 ribosomal protein OS=Fischerella sp. JSC-11 GN=FJSC11DRAFT_4052 PE=4 SV=1: 23S_rRNA_IVP [Gemmataceae bacterium]VTU00700.1 S23 ribosomal protein OS=Fischerella sp. JSC-11 GN=FJSC11DRAFT_4052 PE=4 SV=1: 23S_rRNA_IVP [Gemmataceae bacterium]
MGQPSFETLEVYRLADALAGDVWNLVMRWPLFARDTIGKQLVRAADSIGANLAEGYGRGSYADNKRFTHIARGSLNETLCWLKRGLERKLIAPEDSDRLKRITDELGPRLNGYLNYINRQLAAQATRGERPKA